MHDFVLQGGDAKRALSAIGFGYEYPSAWFGSVRTGMNFLVQSVYPINESFLVVSPSENRNDVASVASWAARFPTRFPPFPLSVISSRDASARDATSSIFNDLQAAGSISNLVERWGIETDNWPINSCSFGVLGSGRTQSEDENLHYAQHSNAHFFGGFQCLDLMGSAGVDDGVLPTAD